MTDPLPAERSRSQHRYVGRVFGGRYEVVEYLARGSMGFVFRARQIELARDCALKILDPSVFEGAGPEYRTRFLREAKVASRISHPNVVTIYDFGEEPEGGECFIAMELLSGETLAHFLKREKRLPWRQAVKLASQMVRGLRASHDLGIVHRDLKPGNVFLVAIKGQSSQVKLVDFGLGKQTEETRSDATLTMTGIFMGSPLYTSPEQVSTTRVDGRADLYALGVVLFEMVTGRVPFNGPHEAAILVQHMNDAPPRPREVAPDAEIPEELEAIILRCLQKSPDARFASAAELLHALRKTLDPGAAETTGSVRAAAGAPSWLPLQSLSIAAVGGSSVTALSSRTEPPVVPRPSPFARAAVARRSVRVVAASVLAMGLLVVAMGTRRRVEIVRTANGDSVSSGAPLARALASPSLSASSPHHALDPAAPTDSTSAPAPAAAAIQSGAADAPRPVDTAGAVARAAPDRTRPRAAAVAAPAATTGRLFVWIDLGTCQAAVDGVERGAVPTGALDVSAGAHTVTCTFADGSVRTSSVDVPGGKSASVRFSRN